MLYYQQSATSVRLLLCPVFFIFLALSSIYGKSLPTDLPCLQCSAVAAQNKPPQTLFDAFFRKLWWEKKENSDNTKTKKFVEICFGLLNYSIMEVQKFMFGQLTYRNFLCHCDSRYVGRISSRLQERIKQHIPKSIFLEHASQDQSTFACFCKSIRSLKAETSFSAIGQHLLQNPACAQEYNDGKFSILA